MVLVALSSMVGCEAPPVVFTDVLPDDRLILHEEELIPRGIPDEPSEWASWLLEEARATNRRHTELVLLIEAVTVLPARYRDRGEDDAVVWGPWIIDDEAERLWVEDRGGRYAWTIERQTVDPDRVRFDDEAWTPDLLGEIGVSAEQPTGGEFVIDVDEVGFGVIGEAADVLDDATPGTAAPDVDAAPIGRAALRYSNTRHGATLTTFSDLDEAVVAVPETGGLTFAHEPGQGGTVSGTVRRETETVDVRVQWAADGGGRADWVGASGARTECWGADHGRTFLTGGAGAEADCRFGPAP